VKKQCIELDCFGAQTADPGQIALVAFQWCQPVEPAMLSAINQFEGPMITFRDGHFGKPFKQNSVGISTDAVLH
jgi:hypothetical protein